MTSSNCDPFLQTQTLSVSPMSSVSSEMVGERTPMRLVKRAANPLLAADASAVSQIGAGVPDGWHSSIS
jgi:hypothetical protein